MGRVDGEDGAGGAGGRTDRGPTAGTAAAASSLRLFYDGVDRSCPGDPHRVAVLLRMLQSAVTSSNRALRVLDLGCGSGEVGGRVAAALPATVVALDWVVQGMAPAAARHLSIVQAAVGEACLPFRSRRFDAVVMSEVIEHLVDVDGALTEARRVLVPGGTLVLSTPNLAAWFNRLGLLVGMQPVFSEVSRMGVFGRPGSIVVGHLRLCTARALRQLLEAHGFVDVRLAGASYHDVPRALRPLDRLLARRAGVAAILVARATAPEAPGA